MTVEAVADAKPEVLWLDDVAADLRSLRPPLVGEIDVDVAIVGGGFSGLWTAYYLLRHDPDLRVAILEREYCGYGASGRNGGWCIGELAGSFSQYAKRSSPAEALRQARTVFATVDEVGRVADVEGIDCGFRRGGTIRVARNAPQAARQREEITRARDCGFTEDEIRLLDSGRARALLAATDVRSGIFFGPTAALHPGKLVRGLAHAVERAGGVIYEQTPVMAIAGRRVEVIGGAIRARSVVRATEAYTRDLPGHRRALLPVYSYMIATEPLSEAVMGDLGLAGPPTFADDRYMVIYGQRTADNRIAFGGTGTPYRWASTISRETEFDLDNHTRVHDWLIGMLPQLRGVAITHRWGGVLAIPRNWVPGLFFDPETGLGAFGGYVGEGVAASNLAGRTMADLIAGRRTDRTSLPWVGARARRWEPEPFRWLGVQSSRRLLAAADRRERVSDRTARVAFRISRLLRGA